MYSPPVEPSPAAAKRERGTASKLHASECWAPKNLKKIQLFSNPPGGLLGGLLGSWEAPGGQFCLENSSIR